jgi:carboxyl-terminal processing protease
MSAPKSLIVFKKVLPKIIIIFLVSVFALAVTFVFGYNLGQKGKSIGIVGFRDVTNTEVGKPSNLDFSLYWEAWNKLKNDSVSLPDTQKMIYGSISGMFSSLDDPYTVFFTPEDNKRFKEDIQGEFDGIGVELVQKSGLVTVVSPLSESPGEKAGIKAGDVVVEVEGIKSSTLGFNEVIDKIRGKKGTTVNIKIMRAGKDDLLNFDVIRDTIVVKSVTWEEKTSNGKKILYVKVRQFGDDTDKLFESFVDEAVSSKPDGIVIDLRNDPGGYFETAINLSSYFVDGGTIVAEQDRSGEKKEFSVTKKARLKNFKTVILVNGGSASASEIMSGALQDHKSAKIIGEKTFGKGSVQELVDLSDGSAVKITVAKWLTPNGRTINGEGITPDIEVKSAESGDSDPQFDRAIQYIVTGL